MEEKEVTILHQSVSHNNARLNTSWLLFNFKNLIKSFHSDIIWIAICHMNLSMLNLIYTAMFCLWNVYVTLRLKRKFHLKLTIQVCYLIYQLWNSSLKEESQRRKSKQMRSNIIHEYQNIQPGKSWQTNTNNPPTTGEQSAPLSPYTGKSSPRITHWICLFWRNWES